MLPSRSCHSRCTEPYTKCVVLVVVFVVWWSKVICNLSSRWSAVSRKRGPFLWSPQDLNWDAPFSDYSTSGYCLLKYFAQISRLLHLFRTEFQPLMLFIRNVWESLFQFEVRSRQEFLKFPESKWGREFSLLDQLFFPHNLYNSGHVFSMHYLSLLSDRFSITNFCKSLYQINSVLQLFPFSPWAETRRKKQLCQRVVSCWCFHPF